MQEVSRETLSNLHTSPIVWQYWPTISLQGVQQYMDQEDTTSIIDPNAKGPFAVLKTFLRQVKNFESISLSSMCFCTAYFILFEIVIYQSDMSETGNQFVFYIYFPKVYNLKEICKLSKQVFTSTN